MVYDKDDEDWNMLYYVVKGGNLVVFKIIEMFFNECLCEIICDERIVLYIVCINNRVEICEYICNKKLYESIIKSMGEFREWMVVYYVVVEERYDGIEEIFICMLVKGGIDLYVIIVDGLIVFGVVCEY